MALNNKVKVANKIDTETEDAVSVKVHHEKSSKKKLFPIVCIGGSAGSFQPMEVFFNHLPADSGMAFILVMHLDKNHSGSLAALIQTYTSMQVTEAADGMEVEENHVYLIPPNYDMGIHNRRLLLLAPSKPNGYNLSIDYFLQSLAEDQWNRAIAIILSGMGSDGETGIRMIKEKLGMVMVQDPETALYGSMPQSAISTNAVDYVLAPEEMPLKLLQYLRHPAMVEELNEESKAESRDVNAVHKILMLLRAHTGHDFAQYKKNTITRRINRQLVFHQLTDYNQYINVLREDPHEIDALFNELLIGVTKFFRDHAAFDIVKEKLFTLLRHKADGEPLRVWVAGCSTGEEAYSIAILVMECLPFITPKIGRKVQIFATDLDIDAIEHARAGVYMGNIVADVSTERLEKYFIKKDDRFLVKKELREMIVFAQHNLIKDAPFTRLDLLCCRNVMIYLNADLQKKIIPVFHYSLTSKGVLFLGPAETLGGFSDQFAPVDPKWKIYERKEGSSDMGKMIDFPFNISKPSLHVIKYDDMVKPLDKKSISQNFSSLLLDQYTPPSVLINEKGHILFINGKTSSFLELRPGEATMDINKMAKEELRHVLSNAIYQARQQKASILIKDIKIHNGEKLKLINLRVDYLHQPVLQGLILVLFEDKGIVEKPELKKNVPANQLATEELEKELLYTKQQLHNTVEQMETSLEELKSTNEELQSTNEELQSTNEESLTTKEEMQSLNEELMTINAQYQTKAQEINQLNNDMKNMLENTEIGTIFLDFNMNILRYTPQIKELFNLIGTDVGRSLNDIVLNFDYPELKSDINHVIETLIVKSVEVKTNKNEWYILRIMPYRTLDNFINGVVLTFNKITSLKLAEAKIMALSEYANSLIDMLPPPALLLDSSLHIINVNDAFKTYFKLYKQELTGKNFAVLAHEVWKTSKTDHVLKEGIREQGSLTFKHDFPGIGLKNILLTINPLIEKVTNETLLVMIVIEEKPE